MPANLENAAVATGLEKVSFHSSPNEMQCQSLFKLLHNCIHLTRQQSNAQNSPSQASIVRESRTLDVQAGFRNGRGTKDQIANISWTQEKQESSRKTSTSASLTTLKPLTVRSQQTGKFLKRQEYRPPYLPPVKPVFRSRSYSQNWTWTNGLVQNWERSMLKLYIVTLLI